MNLKKKLRKFFTLTRTANGGFTLVELIVVIAILAILGGIAVPSYNLYVKKARERADLELIAAVNNAFAAACLNSQVEVKDVSAASVSVLENKVYGVSTVTTDPALDDDTVNQIAVTFNALFTGNHDTEFVTENVNSLQWNDEEDTFEISADYTSTRIILSNGKTVNVSAEDMQAIVNSAYADMNASGVTEAINSLVKSSQTLANVAYTLNMGDRLTNVIYANGLTATSADASALSTTEAANGLQMVTAKYLAGATETNGRIETLLNTDLGGSTLGMLQPLADGTGGTVTCSAAALQYALVEAFANSSTSAGTTVSYEKYEQVGTTTLFGQTIPKYDYVTYTHSVSDFLVSDYAAEDPIRALTMVKNTDGYKAYAQTEQYQKDIDGFVGIMGILGSNIGTVSKPGAIDIPQYFASGVNCTSAQEVLKAVLGD